MLKQLTGSKTSFLCYNCVDRLSVWQSERVYSIAKNLLDPNRMDLSFLQGFCNCDYCVCQGSVRRLSKEAVCQLKLVLFYTKNWTFHSLSFLSGLVALALTVLQSPKKPKSGYSTTAAAILKAIFLPETLWHQGSVNAVSHSAMLCFSINPLIFQSYIKPMITFQILKMAFGSLTQAVFYFEYWNELLFSSWTCGRLISQSSTTLHIQHH